MACRILGASVQSLAAAGLVMAMAASAEAGGPYVAAFGGLDYRYDQDDIAPGAAIDLSYETGSVIGGALGYAVDVPFTASLRIELEVASRASDFDNIEFEGFEDIPVETTAGEQTALSGMINAAFDLDLPLVWLEPYVGAGAGFARIDTDLAAADGTGASSEAETKFAYQVFAGLNAPLPLGFEVFAEGRYFNAGESELARVEVAGEEVVVFESDFASAAVLVGGRFRF